MMTLKIAAFDLGNTLIGEGFSMDSTLHPLPGVQESLAALSRELTLCVASNSGFPIEHTRKTLERAGILHYFQHVYSSASLGTAKPDPQFFQRIMAQLNAQPAECVMIGDSYFNDIMGAKDVGWHTIWLANRPGSAPSHADAVIESMHAVVEAITQIDRRLSTV